MNRDSVALALAGCFRGLLEEPRSFASEPLGNIGAWAVQPAIAGTDIDLAAPDFPEPFDPEIHQGALDTIRYYGDHGWEIPPGLGRWCEELGPACTGAKVAAVIVGFAIGERSQGRRRHYRATELH